MKCLCYLPVICIIFVASRSSITVPDKMPFLSSNSEWSDSVATCGLDQRSPPSSTSSSNLIHLEDSQFYIRCTALPQPFYQKWPKIDTKTVLRRRHFLFKIAEKSAFSIPEPFYQLCFSLFKFSMWTMPLKLLWNQIPTMSVSPSVWTQLPTVSKSVRGLCATSCNFGV